MNYRMVHYICSEWWELADGSVEFLTYDNKKIRSKVNRHYTIPEFDDKLFKFVFKKYINGDLLLHFVKNI